METARGRWFLAEFARRNRNADTTMLLKALDRIESAVTGDRSVDDGRPHPLRSRRDGERDRAHQGRDRGDQAGGRSPASSRAATEELDCVVQTTEAATSDILACAERIQELAWTMREQGLAPDVCDLIDARATEIYTACSFQDLTGQRIRKVIGVLRYLEGRINAMIDDLGPRRRRGRSRTSRAAEATLLHGPARTRRRARSGRRRRRDGSGGDGRAPRAGPALSSFPRRRRPDPGRDAAARASSRVARAARGEAAAALVTRGEARGTRACRSRTIRSRRSSRSAPKRRSHCLAEIPVCIVGRQALPVLLSWTCALFLCNIVAISSAA